VSRIPVYVLSGFLGAGKTSLLNAMLREGGLGRTGVIVNEFGEIGLDSLFLGIAGDALVEMAGGCLCCAGSGELSGTLMQLAARDIDRVVIETSGLADPGPVLDSLLQDPILGERYEPGGVVTLVDALNAETTLEAHEEARSQVALADLLVVTKADLLSAADSADRLARLASLLRRYNLAAPILPRPGPEEMAAMLRRRLWLPRAHGHDHDHDHHHHAHASGVRSVSIRHEAPLPKGAVEAFGQLLASAHGAHVLRLKGIVSILESDRPLAIHGVHNRFHEPQLLDSWPDEDRSTRIVAILHDMDPAFVRQLFSAFANIAAPDTPDRQAMTENPLAIPMAPARR